MLTADAGKKNQNMKIEIQKTVTEFVEVALPIYRKNPCHFYKVFSEEHCVQICTLTDNPAVQVCHSGLAYHGTTTEDCTKEEFEAGLKETLERINFRASDLYKEEQEEQEDETDAEINELEDNSEAVNRAHEISEGMER